MNADELIAQIRAVRLEKGIKQSTIAERMGVSASYVQAIEYRKGIDRRWGTLMAYAEAVGVQVNITVQQ